MHSFLQKQKMQYTLFIVEQAAHQRFNRGLLLNVGYITAMQRQNFTCIVLHDVDLLPTNERNLYRCTKQVRHMGTANSKYNYTFKTARPRFSRGLLLNVRYNTAMQLQNFTFLVLHDVDLLPTNERNLYRCTKQVRHMGTANSKYNYTLLYPDYFGGVLSILPSIFEELNGFSNLFFGWGVEDDDFFQRLKQTDTLAGRLPFYLGKYEALNHTVNDHDPGALIPREYLRNTAGLRRTSDGLNSVFHKQIAFDRRPLYTWVKVGTNETEYFLKLKACAYHGWPCTMKDVSWTELSLNQSELLNDVDSRGVPIASWATSYVYVCVVSTVLVSLICLLFVFVIKLSIGFLGAS